MDEAAEFKTPAKRERRVLTAAQLAANRKNAQKAGRPKGLLNKNRRDLRSAMRRANVPMPEKRSATRLAPATCAQTLAASISSAVSVACKKTPGGGATIALPMASTGVRCEITIEPWFEDCNTDQTGQVFFLGGKACSTGDTTCNASVAKRICAVPKGKNLFFPIVNSEDSVAEEIANETKLRTINELRKFVQGVIDGTTNLEIDLDGQSLKDLRAFRA
jgi:hypothetical protein